MVHHIIDRAGECQCLHRIHLAIHRRDMLCDMGLHLTRQHLQIPAQRTEYLPSLSTFQDREKDMLHGQILMVLLFGILNGLGKYFI